MHAYTSLQMYDTCIHGRPDTVADFEKSGRVSPSTYMYICINIYVSMDRLTNYIYIYIYTYIHTTGSVEDGYFPFGSFSKHSSLSHDEVKS